MSTGTGGVNSVDMAMLFLIQGNKGGGEGLQKDWGVSLGKCVSLVLIPLQSYPLVPHPLSEAHL